MRVQKMLGQINIYIFYIASDYKYYNRLLIMIRLEALCTITIGYLF